MQRRRLIYTIIALIVFWQFCTVVLQKPILPGPITVGITLIMELLKGQLGIHFLVSLWRVLVGMGLAIFTAAPAGLFLGQSKKLNQIFTPVIYVLYPIPKVVFVPIIMLFFGIGDMAKIIIILAIPKFQFGNDIPGTPNL